jgi:hypothetical protein
MRRRLARTFLRDFGLSFFAASCAKAATLRMNDFSSNADFKLAQTVLGTQHSRYATRVADFLFFLRRSHLVAQRCMSPAFSSPIRARTLECCEVL